MSSDFGAPDGVDEPTVASVGEFGLIERIRAIVGPGNVAVGIGDDTAVLDQVGPNYVLATVDMLVEGVHFRRDLISPHDIGRRALAVNVSDIAAMGGWPMVALTSISLRPETSLRYVEDIYRGMQREAEAFGVTIAGGNTTRTSGPLSIDVTLLGEVPKAEVILRSGARVGDSIAVTGTLGERTAARLVLERSLEEDLGALLGRAGESIIPQPRASAGRALAVSHLAHAMLDISDGLAGDLQHLCASSGVGAVISESQLPISTFTREIAGLIDRTASDLALFGGEDYELLISLPAAAIPEARRVIRPVPLTVVGHIRGVHEGVKLQRSDGEQVSLNRGGWTHF